MSADNSQEPSRTTRLIIVAVVFAIALGLDLWSKAWVWDNLTIPTGGNGRVSGPPVTVIEHVFYLKFGFNTGSAFSFLRDESWARYFFITVTFLALGYMGWLAWKMPTSRVYGFIAVGLIAAGAAGNLHDRLVRIMPVWMDGELVERYGVVDFLQFYYNWPKGKYWPIFNVADSALVCGVGLLLVFLHYHGAEGELGDGSDEASSEASESDEAEPDSDSSDSDSDSSDSDKA